MPPCIVHFIWKTLLVMVINIIGGWQRVSRTDLLHLWPHACMPRSSLGYLEFLQRALRQFRQTRTLLLCTFHVCCDCIWDVLIISLFHYDCEELRILYARNILWLPRFFWKTALFLHQIELSCTVLKVMNVVKCWMAAVAKNLFPSGQHKQLQSVSAVTPPAHLSLHTTKKSLMLPFFATLLLLLRECNSLPLLSVNLSSQLLRSTDPFVGTCAPWFRCFVGLRVVCYAQCQRLCFSKEGYAGSA